MPDNKTNLGREYLYHFATIIWQNPSQNEHVVLCSDIAGKSYSTPLPSPLHF